VPGFQDLTIRTVEPDDAEAISALILGAFDAGELQGSRRIDCEHWARLTASEPERSLVAVKNGQILGIISPRWNQLVVHADHRRRGMGRALIRSGEKLATTHSEDPLAIALPHDNPGAQRFLEALGYAYHHSLWRMQFTGQPPLDVPDLPASFQARSYRHDDLIPYVELFNRAFADHPTPLSLSVELAKEAHARESFDPDDIVLIVAEPEGALSGFCRIVIEHGENGPEGEVMVLGVDPPARGKGLGRWLLGWGVNRAHTKGAANIFLAVEGDNQKALLLYRSTGFDLVEEWPRWCKSEA
jgi:mycothiol synthase